MNVRNMREESEFLPAATGAAELNVQTAVVKAADTAMPTGATHAMIGVKTATVNMGFGRDPADGGAGIPLTAGTIRILNAKAWAQARFIRGAGSNAVVSVEFGTFA